MPQAPVRIDSVTLRIEDNQGVSIQVCDTRPSANTPYDGVCTNFTPNQPGNGLRVFSGIHDASPGNVLWVVMNSVRESSVGVNPNSHPSAQTFVRGSWAWIGTNLAIIGMTVTGSPLPTIGACGSAASDDNAFTTAPSANLCSTGTLTASGVLPLMGRYIWQCKGYHGGADSPSCSAPQAHAITTSAANGSIACTPNPVPWNQSTRCTATPDDGYQFTAWTGACSGTDGACHLVGVTGPLGVGAHFTLAPVDAACGAAATQPVAMAPSANLCAAGTPGGVLSANGQHAWECAGLHGGSAQQCSAPWADAGQGTGTVRVDGAGGWRIASAAFDAAAVPALPPGARSVHAPLALVLEGGSGPARVTVTYTEPAPAGAVYLKHGPSRDGLGCTGADCAQPHWYALPGAAFSADRTQVTLELADGGDGDADGTADGRITDPGLPALLAAPAGAQAIPALSGWALALMAALAGLLVRRRLRAY
jgi:hypothetical protein